MVPSYSQLDGFDGSGSSLIQNGGFKISPPLDDSGMVPNSLPPGWCVRYPTPGDIFNNSKAATGTRTRYFLII